MKGQLVYFNIILKHNDSMCHDPAMANHSLSLSEVRLTDITLLTVGTEMLPEVLVNFDVSPKSTYPKNDFNCTTQFQDHVKVMLVENELLMCCTKFQMSSSKLIKNDNKTQDNYTPHL